MYRYFKQFGSAIQFMHENGFAHNDIKLNNVLIFKNTGDEKRSYCKITDFGLSGVSYLKGIGVIKKHNYCGTKYYMSPGKPK